MREEFKALMRIKIDYPYPDVPSRVPKVGDTLRLNKRMEFEIIEIISINKEEKSISHSHEKYQKGIALVEGILTLEL